MKNTLFVGLGGFGGRVVTQMKKRMEQSNMPMRHHKFILLDRDGLELAVACQESQIPGVQMRLEGTCGQYILKHPDRETIREWFPEGPSWFDATQANVQNRVLGRLAFLAAMEQGIGRRLEYMLYPLLAAEGFREDLRIVIVTSLSGGTGSGCFIQLAQLLRNLLFRYWDINPQICGFFAGPEVFRWDLHSFPKMVIMRANAHAAWRELHWLTQLRLHAITPPKRVCLDGLLDSDKSVPLKIRAIYNQAFLYDAGDQARKERMTVNDHIAKMAESLYYRYGSSMTPSIDALQKGRAQWNLGVRVYVQINEDVDRNIDLFMQPDSGIQIEACRLAESIKFVSAYIRWCKNAMDNQEPGPHIDKRWPSWLIEHW